MILFKLVKIKIVKEFIIMEIQKIIEKALIDSVSEAFAATLSISPQITEKSLSVMNGSIVSMLGFTGFLEGSFTICMSGQSACKVVSIMLDTEIDEVTADVADGVGEMMNLIAGGVKMKIIEITKNFIISTPVTVSGGHLEVLKRSKKSTRIMKVFICEDIEFSILLDYKVHVEKVEVEEVEKKSSVDALSKLSELIGKENNPNK